LLLSPLLLLPVLKLLQFFGVLLRQLLGLRLMLTLQFLLARLIRRLPGGLLACSLLLLLLRQLLGLRLMLARQFLLARLVRRLAGDSLALSLLLLLLRQLLGLRLTLTR